MVNPRRLAPPLLIALIAVALIGSVEPAFGGLDVDEQPDLKIFGPEGVDIGEDEYYENDGPQGSTVIGLDVGEKQTWKITVENDGLVPSRYRIHGGSGNTDFAVKYVKGGANISRAVRAGSFRTARLDPDQSTTLKLKVTSNNQDGSGDLFRVSVLGSAAKDPRDNDLVLAFINNL
jgi:hypothetical protein